MFEAVHRRTEGGMDRGSRMDCCLVMQAFQFHLNEIRLEIQIPGLAS